MAKPASISDLFRDEPVQWGLRGDPYLWRDMRERLGAVACPDTADELATIVEATFQELTGRPITHPDHFYVEKYSHGGMSSGGITPSFWRDTAIPLLRRRHAEACPPHHERENR